jgi:hypothetical protein
MKLVLIVIIVALSGCKNTSKNAIAYQNIPNPEDYVTEQPHIAPSLFEKIVYVKGRLEYKDFPPLNIVKTSNIGTTLLTKAKVETNEGFRLNSPVTGHFGIFLCKYAVGDYYLRQTTKSLKKYFPTDPNLVSHKDGSHQGRFGFAIDKKSGEIKGCSLGSSPVKLDQAPSITKKMVTIVNETNFKQELVYNGKSGDIARFLYREYSGNMARPAFTQELTYDLSASKIIGFREVRLQVLATSNTSIKYKVISGFTQNN